MYFSFRSEQESGRSMVEMLGVITISSVLMVGGIYLYQIARNAVLTNTIISEARIRLLALSRHGASKNEAASRQTLRGFQKKPDQNLILDKYEIDLEQNERGPILIIKNLPTVVCAQLKVKADIDCDNQNQARFDLTFLNSDSE